MSSLRRIFSSKKSPTELVHTCADCYKVISKIVYDDPHGYQQSSKYQKFANVQSVEELGRLFQQIKAILYGEGEVEPKKTDVQEAAKEANNTNLLQTIVQYLEHLDFEARKDAAQIYNNMLKLTIGGKLPMVEYVHENKDILYMLMSFYERTEIALLCGSMLRESLKHELLAKDMLNNTEQLYKIFNYVDLSHFEVASDAFATFKEILSRHKPLISEFLDHNFDSFFLRYTKLLKSDNYVTKRQSLRLLGEILLDRSNFNIMKRYINKKDNLKLMMNLLLDKRKNIQIEAFHVFKVFVANPNKDPEVVEILYNNKVKIVKFLKTFHEDKTEDEQFIEEKALLISKINNISDPHGPPQTADNTPSHEDEDLI
ncbi:calcium binding protein [Acrasis kona]|uniref:Calcium binding protein n=1 Tax=Acrasis kona TaxID=1008807 RepID=A0AAW2YRT5_9EUKA